MSDMKHSPGPWKVVEPGHGFATGFKCVEINEEQMYATSELLPADACLMAAAPELLEACENALRLISLEVATAEDYGATRDHLQRVIQKAYGIEI